MKERKILMEEQDSGYIGAVATLSEVVSRLCSDASAEKNLGHMFDKTNG